jgi:hypothetical protein
MTQRNIHYEAAFEDLLRSRGVPYVAVDEARRAIFSNISLKSFDFLVYSESGPNLIVDVKGRKFPDTLPGPKKGASRIWENWITRGDAEDLQKWQGVFGPDYQAVLVFAYWLQGPPRRAPFEEVHCYRKNQYAFMAIPLADYLSAARLRSVQWQTLTMPTREFTRRIKDLSEFL